VCECVCVCVCANVCLRTRPRMMNQQGEMYAHILNAHQRTPVEENRLEDFVFVENLHVPYHHAQHAAECSIRVRGVFCR